MKYLVNLIKTLNEINKSFPSVQKKNVKIQTVGFRTKF